MLGEEFVLDLGEHLHVLFQEITGVVATLAESLAVVAVPSPGLVDDVRLDGEVEHVTAAADALTEEDIELADLERRGHLVLDDLDPRAVADGLVADLDRADAADIEALRGVELQGIAAGGGLRAAEHHADLHADLVDEEERGVALLDGASELAEGLAHQAGLKADVAVAHLALDLGLGDQSRDRIDDDDVDGARTHEGVGDLQGLLAMVRLAHQELVHVDAELTGVAGIERVLCVDERRDAARLLGFGDRVEGERGLAARLGAVDLDDAAACIAPDA